MCCILFSPIYGRYDLAMNTSAPTRGASGNSLNLWEAGKTDNGPWATTQHNSEWGERGSLVNEYSLAPDLIYNITICGKHQGVTADGNEFFTCYVFVNDSLVIYQRDIVYWDGGFGIRGYLSPYEYTNFKVTDFPKVCPDGIDHYTEDDENTGYSTKTFKSIGTPTLRVEGKKVIWDAVENAGGYCVYDGTTFLDFVTECSYDFSSLYTDGTTLKVQAFPKKFNSLAGESASIEVSNPATPLLAPVISLNDEVVSWEAVPNASSYQIYVNNELYTEQTGTSFYPLFTTKGSYVIKVKAISDSPAYSNSQFSNEVTYSYSRGLDIADVEYSAGVVTWTGDAKATGYKIYLNGEYVTTVTECSYTVPDSNDYAITVIATDSSGINDESEPVTVYTTNPVTLAKPVIKTAINNQITWDPISNATKYAIYRNGIYLTETTDTGYRFNDLAVYQVKAIGNKGIILDSELSAEFISMNEAKKSPTQLDTTSTQQVGDLANFGWNDTCARFTIQERDESGNVWFGTDDPSVFHETWFWAKQSGNVLFDDWTYEADVKFRSSTGGNFQLLCGTASTGGRYACCFWPNGGMNIHRNYELVGTYCEDLTKPQVNHIQINHGAASDGSGVLTVYVNGKQMLKTNIANKAIGDYGLWLEKDVDAVFANVIVSDLKVGPKGQFDGAPIKLNAPAVSQENDEIVWTDSQNYVLGYDVYLNGSLIAKLKSDVKSFAPRIAGEYTIRAAGNGKEIITSVDSQVITIS